MTLLAKVYANRGELPQALEWCQQAIAADKLNPGGHYLLAVILQEQGRLPEAVASLKRTLYLDQDFTLAHFALGNLHQRQGKLKEAIPFFEKARSLDPANNVNGYDLALAYAGTGALDKARAQIGDMLARGDRAELHNLLGLVEEKAGHVQLAADQYQQATRFLREQLRFGQACRVFQ